MTALVVDRAMLTSFIGELFRYADQGTYVQLRAFYDRTQNGSGESGAWGTWPVIKMNGSGLGELVDAAVRFAQDCANAPQSIVFCPPIVSLNSGNEAAEKNIANGVVLSVECDQNPAAARELLERLLGPATIVVASGGEWKCPLTGKVEPKLHLHWRLQEPTREFRDHQWLKEARRLAQQLAGADGSAVPLVHPLRWPGSWHRKGEPRLARILALNDDAEIDLGDALERLREAVAAQGDDIGEADYATHEANDPEASIFDVFAALEVIPNYDLPWDQWNRIAMATWAATGGAEPGFHAFDAWSRKSAKYGRAETRARWDHISKYPPDRIGFGTLAHLAKEARLGWRKPSADFVAPPSGDPFMDYTNRNRPGGSPRADEEEEDFNAGDSTKPDPAAYTAQAWLDRDLPEQDLLLGPFSTTSRGMLVATTGLGKTNVAIAMAFAMATGKPFLNWKSHRSGRILFIDGEMSKRLLRLRIRDAARRAGVVPHNLYFLCRDDFEMMPPLNTRAGQQFIESFIEQIGGVDFIYFDNVQALLLGDMKDEEPWQQTLPWIRSLTRRSIGQLWVHHTGHDASRSYGTKTREWQLDSVLLLETVERTGTDIAFSLKFTKARDRALDNRNDFDPVVVTLVNDIWAAEGGVSRSKPPSPMGFKFLNGLLNALAAPHAIIVKVNGRPAVSVEQWKAECVRLGLIDPKDKPHSQRALFNKYRRELIERDQIACQGDLVWTIR